MHLRTLQWRHQQKEDDYFTDDMVPSSSFPAGLSSPDMIHVIVSDLEGVLFLSFFFFHYMFLIYVSFGAKQR